MPEVMVALDLDHYWSQAPFELIRRLRDAGCTHYKVHDPLPGMDLKATVAYLRKAVLPGKSAVIMYDNKEHDIPTRVAKAVENHVSMGFDLVTVHATGLRDMLTTLVRAGLEEHCVAVTILTSTRESDLLEVFNQGREHLEHRLAWLAYDCGIRGGIVCGAPDIPSLRSIASDIPFMTPGIYLPGQEKSSDQRVAATPAEAAAFGATHVIVGRSIISSKQPEKIFANIKAQIESAA